ncbi:hypothetical protein ACHQM5_012037 [Ranunculus cassubicifolius]
MGDVKKWSATYTIQINQKRKVFEDGVLELHCSNGTNKALLYGVCGKILASKFLKKNELVGSGETLTFDGYLVDIGDLDRNCDPLVLSNGGGKDVESSIEWLALYTSQKTQKTNQRHDGILRLVAGTYSDRKQVTLVNKDGTTISNKHLNSTTVENIRTDARLELARTVVAIRRHGTTNLAFLFNLGAIIAADQRLTDNDGHVDPEMRGKIAQYRQCIYTLCGGETELDDMQRRLHEGVDVDEPLSVEQIVYKIQAEFWKGSKNIGAISAASLVVGVNEHNEINVYEVDVERYRKRGENRKYHSEDKSYQVSQVGNRPLVVACGSGGSDAKNVVDNGIGNGNLTPNAARNLAAEALFEAMTNDECTGGPINVGYLSLDGRYWQIEYSILRLYQMIGGRFEDNSLLVMLRIGYNFERDLDIYFKRCFSRALVRRTVVRKAEYVLFRVTYTTVAMTNLEFSRVGEVRPWGDFDQGINWYGTLFYVLRFIRLVMRDYALIC